ncbi:hypothetical protein EV426DRAFT_577409 [Tirmania nivea]|nr:hypothetical protein EV426DRAFT_577409 [Tirmania nivea]
MSTSDKICDEKLPLEFTAYFHLPHRRGRGATDFNFGRWVQHHSCEAGFPADRAERHELWERILTHFANDHEGENTQEVDDAVRGKAREAITKMKKVKRKVGGGAAGMTVNKVMLKGVRAGRDINVNVGIAAALGAGLAEREEPIPKVDIPPPPYMEWKDGGGSESGRVGENGGDRLQRTSNRYSTRKRPRSQSPSDSPAPPSPESTPNKQPQPPPSNLNFKLPTTTSTSTSRSQKRLRTNPNANPTATTNVTATTTPEQGITSISDTITPHNHPSNPNSNPNHDNLFTFRESLFTIHTQLTLLRGEVDRLRDAVAGLFQHEALAVLDTLRDPMSASVRNSGGELQTGRTKIKADEIEVGSETEKDPSLREESINSEAAVLSLVVGGVGALVSYLDFW